MTQLAQITIQAPAAQVYYALTNPGALQEWLCDAAESEPRKGGRLYLAWETGQWAAGAWTALKPSELLSYEVVLKGRELLLPVSITLRLAEQAEVTELTIEQAGIDQPEVLHVIAQRAQHSLINLKSVLETGLDQRIYSRPMLGFMIGGKLDATQAAELGVPVTKGIRLAGTIPGMGAASAGLQADDVIVRLNAKAISGFSSLGQALSNRTAGETVEVEFYRGSAKQSVPMLLSPRPIPAVPAEPADLAVALGSVHAALDDELGSIFAEVTEDQAAAQPAPGEWSANQVIAHLIATERVTQISLAFQLGGVALNDFPSNSAAWIESITAVYPTSQDLIAALKRSEQETVAMAAALPPAYVERKAAYLAWANYLLHELPGHSRMHFTQLRTAILAAPHP